MRLSQGGKAISPCAMPILNVLGWKAERGLDEMCEDSWRWQSQNPNGYEG